VPPDQSQRPDQTQRPDQHQQVPAQDQPRDGIDRGDANRPPVPLVGVDSSQYGVPRVVTRDVSDWTRTDQTLFRGDARSPAEIRADGGFRPPYMTREGWQNHPEWATPDIAQHVGGRTNAFVSTSTDRTVGENFAISSYVYEINAPGGIYTDPTLHPVTGRETHGEGEVLFPGGINWGYVRGWYEMRYEPGTGFVGGDFVPNPDYIGDRASTPTTTDTSAATPPGTDQAPTRPDQRQDPNQPPPYQSQPYQRGESPTGSQPGQQPGSQTDRPSQPTNRPGQQTDRPSQLTNQLGQPTGGPGQQTNRPSQSTDQLGQTTERPGQETDGSGQSTDRPGQPTDQSNQYGPATQEATRPGEPSNRDTSPTTDQYGGDRPASLGDRMGPLNDPRLDALRPHLQSTEGGMSAFAPPDSSDSRQRWDHQNDQYTANQVPRIPGQFVVDMHGSPDSVRIGDTQLSPRDLADIIRANPDYDGGPVSLLGCNTGSDPNGFAARLAQELGVPVTAPTRDAWVDHNGNVFSSSQAYNTDTSKPAKPTWPPNGEWNTYSPNGDQTAHRGPYPPGHTPAWTSDTRAPSAAARRGDDPPTTPDDANRPDEATPSDDTNRPDDPSTEDRDRPADPPDRDDQGEPDRRDQETTDDTPDQDAAEEARARLDELRRDWPDLDRALAGHPATRASLLAHPDSVRMLDDALRDVQNRLDEAGIGDAVRRGDITPEVQAKVDSIVSDLRAQDPNQVLDREDQRAISREIAAGTSRDGYLQTGFDLSRREDPAYQQECVDRLRAEAPRVQERLNEIVSDIAADNGGEAAWRPEVKKEGRCLDKVREYVETSPQGDASMLVDVAGAKIRFNSVDELYRALDALKNDPRVEIVRIKDRVAEATKSGNRSILMNVRIDGHVAELKFGLKSFEAPADTEHSLYEVRRDMDSDALTERRDPTPVESLIKAATEAHARREYGAAWNREMAGSRLHEVLTDHSDVASITQRLVNDSVAHPTNVARNLADPATRDATIATIGELADGRALDGRTLDEYRAANPGQGPLFEPVDPSINTDADGRDRKAVLVEEAKQADPARDVGNTPTPEESARVDDYARRLREDVHPAVEAEVRRFVEAVAPDSSVSVRTKSAEGILDKVERMTEGSESRPGRPNYRTGDVIDAVGARITTNNMRDLEQVLEAAKSHFGVGDDGRILEIENMYAEPKSKNPAYRVIPLVVRVDVDGLPYTFELQLTTQRASIAADLEHNTLFKPYVEMSPTEKEKVRRMLAEAAALDQEETR
jgi:ppGpp synthetase/RelA/SpoT-type nucleotidyltranferase